MQHGKWSLGGRRVNAHFTFNVDMRFYLFIQKKKKIASYTSSYFQIKSIQKECKMQGKLRPEDLAKTGTGIKQDSTTVRWGASLISKNNNNDNNDS